VSVVSEAVDRGDLDELTRLIDGLCSSRDWDSVLELRMRCRHALERGLQLWPAAEYAEYRLALEAPGEIAGPLVVDDAGRFALGPLWEVAASSHTWAELAVHIPQGPARALAAHERVIRGEDLSADDSIDPLALEVPLSLEAWEPRYRVAVYRASESDFPSPDPPPMQQAALPGAVPLVEDTLAVEALIAVAAPWAEHSNGEVKAVAVSGSAMEAIASLGHARARVAEISATDALAWLGWAGASGGAYGRRRGTPMGRFAGWWAAAALAGLEWPPEPDDLGAAIDALQWTLWQPEEGERRGWSASIAVEGEEGRAWAMFAVDDRREEDRTHVR
jgi:hypothetical protein